MIRGLFSTPTRPPQTDDRAAFRHARRARAAAALPEFDSETLTRQPFGVIVDPEGRKWRIVRGEVADARYSAASAYYVAEGGEILFLERLPR